MQRFSAKLRELGVDTRDSTRKRHKGYKRFADVFDRVTARLAATEG